MFTNRDRYIHAYTRTYIDRQMSLEHLEVVRKK